MNIPNAPESSTISMFALALKGKQTKVIKEEVQEGSCQSAPDMDNSKFKNKNLDEQIKSSFMQGLVIDEPKQDLNKGLGLALLSKVLGVEKIESQFKVFKKQIKNSCAMSNPELRVVI